ncbi:MAG: nodulin 21-related protein [Candidatus Kapaibacterium sp.]|nr:MAG: nodulin 21-related protein [Candidatus Kapabacteria bacterium]
MEISNSLKKELILIQKNELNEYYVYEALAKKVKDDNTSRILSRIAREELAHSNFWKKYTNYEPKPNRFTIAYYKLLATVFGLTFSLKLMEKAEEKAQNIYEKISEYFPEAEKIIKDEDAHEVELINMIDEEKLKYAGAIVLGLNDALVELTGALAGYTFALQNTFLIAIVGLITGIAASFSMAASSYLSARAEGGSKDHVKSATYTGVAYIITVLLLVIPFFLLSNPFFALLLTLLIAISIIFFFNFYISIAKDYSFKSRFLEMVVINLVVTGITFSIGFAIRKTFDIDI